MEQKRNEMTAPQALSLLNTIIYQKVNLTGAEHDQARAAINVLAKHITQPPGDQNNAGRNSKDEGNGKGREGQNLSS